MFLFYSILLKAKNSIHYILMTTFEFVNKFLVSCKYLTCERLLWLADCDLERGTVTWNDSHRINRIRRVHSQKHVSNSAQTWGKSEQKRMPWYCQFYQNGNYTHNKDHKVSGSLHRHVCATCLQQGKVFIQKRIVVW